jgi:malate dehydrogenase
VTDSVPRDRIEAINQRTRDGGIEIVNLLKTGSAYYAPSSSAAAMAEAILKDSGRVLPCCVLLNGEYEIRQMYCGVPVSLGRGGVKKVVELKLTPEEKASLQKSAEHVKEQVGKLKI